MSSYYIKKNRENLGAFTLEEVQAGVASGRFSLNDRIFSKELGKWQPIAKTGLIPKAEAPVIAADLPPAISDKKRLVVLLLCFFFGGLGVHRFYVGKIGTGIVQVLTLGGFGIWALIDLILIGCGVFKDKDGGLVAEWL